MLSFGPNNAEIVGEQVMLAPSAARTVTGQGMKADTGAHSTARLLLNVTAASGVGQSLTVNIEHSRDGTAWRAHSSFTAATEPSSERKTFGGIDRWIRATWTISGTGSPSFTFSVNGELI